MTRVMNLNIFLKKLREASHHVKIQAMNLNTLLKKFREAHKPCNNFFEPAQSSQ